MNRTVPAQHWRDRGGRQSQGGTSGRQARSKWAVAALFVGVAATASWDVSAARSDRSRRLSALHAQANGGRSACANPIAAFQAAATNGDTLASWQTIGGCGAGSSTGVGGIKWIGRSVSGGWLNVQCQGNYTRFDDGYSYSLNSQFTADVTDTINVGIVIPYLYKYENDPNGIASLGEPGLRPFDLSNQGLGDVNVMATKRLGPIDATSLTLSIGLPTGTHDAAFNGIALQQDRQLGTGKVSGSLLLDHVIDNMWGPVVVGVVVSYPGGKNQLENYRAPSGSVYSYAGYLLGPLVPALGIVATGFYGKDLDRNKPSDSQPAWMVSGHASLEWSSDWIALLLGASLPWSPKGWQPWTAGIGLAISP